MVPIGRSRARVADKLAASRATTSGPELSLPSRGGAEGGVFGEKNCGMGWGEGCESGYEVTRGDECRNKCSEGTATLSIGLVQSEGARKRKPQSATAVDRQTAILPSRRARLGARKWEGDEMQCRYLRATRRVTNARRPSPLAYLALALALLALLALVPTGSEIRYNMAGRH